MTLSEKIIQFTRNSCQTLFYFVVMGVKENFRNYILREGRISEEHKEMVILGNGPSLKEDLPLLIASEEHLHKDMMAVNFFAEDERFEVVRPAYYVLSDPMFFRESIHRERVMHLYELLNERVTWRMNLYVQYYNPEHFDYHKVLFNKNIHIVPFHTQMYYGFPSVERWLFNRGLGSANFGTVVQICEYVALLLGYRQVELLGVDHTLLDGLMVDDENRLCRRITHYYDSEEVKAEPIYQNVPHRPYRMSVYLGEVAELFRGHEVLRRWADTLGARIINRTRHSMIDAYERMEK